MRFQNQVVQPLLVPGQAVARDLLRGTEMVAGRTDRLVRLLCVLHLAGVHARGVRDVGLAVKVAGLPAGGVDRGLRQRRRVGPHIGDVAVLVQPLRHRHRLLGGEAELPRRLLLEGGRAERRVRGPLVGLALDRTDLEGGVLQPAGECRRGGPVKVQDVAAAQFADRVEVAALGNAPSVHGDQCRAERTWARAVRAAGVVRVVAGKGGELGLEVPVLGGPEGYPLPLPVDDQASGHRLDPASRQPGHDLLPQHRRDFVAVQPVEHPPGLVRVDQGLVELARVGDGLRDRLGGDLVEDHPVVGNLRLEFLEQVPGDGLALAVFIRGQQEFVGVLKQVLQLGHLLPLVVRDDVEGLEVVVHVDPEAGPRFLAVLGRDLGRPVGHVPDVADAGLDHVPVAQVARDRARLGR